MDKLFVRAWMLFILFLSLIAIVSIKMTPHVDLAEENGLVGPSLNPSEPYLLNNPMVLIPKGEFVMGSGEGGMDESPVHPVFVDAFEINQFEVTQAQYTEFTNATGYRSNLSRFTRYINMKNRKNFIHPNQPVVHVGWDDASEYCRWIGKRLPTEAEWEKGARGTKGSVWPWEGIRHPTFANFLDEPLHRTAMVGSYKKDVSPFGLYDMAGNVREWVEDWYSEGYYSHAEYRNPRGPEKGTMRVLRGGSWNDTPDLGRTSARMKMFPDYGDVTIGFRCAK